jgi:glucose/arabinose dehydrogenase
MNARYCTLVVISLALFFANTPGRAQQAAKQGDGRGQGAAVGPAQGTERTPTAPPPINWPSPPLPDGPIILDTAIQHQIRLTMTKGLNQPWSMAFLPDGRMLVTERPGCLRIVRDGVLQPDHVAGVPPVQATGLDGLMDIALHPRFSENHLVYLTYHKPAGNTAVNALPSTVHCGLSTDGRDRTAGPEGRSTGAGNPQPVARGRSGQRPPASITLARARWNGGALVDVTDIFSAAGPGVASRITFGQDGMLYMTFGSGDPRPPYTNVTVPPAQDPNSLAGKVLRLKDDGTVPPDNPFMGRAGYRPEIYTMGHRNMIGLTVNPLTGDIWESENGPNGGDEINVLHPGKNYGWPIVNTGRFYLGPRVNDRMFEEGMEQPVVFWVPSIATSGLTFYTGDRFPNWNGHLFAGGLRQGEVPRSGQLVRIDFNEKWEELHRESLLRELQNRIRDVRQGPDGLLYVLTAEDDGALIKIEPVPATAQQTAR